MDLHDPRISAQPDRRRGVRHVVVPRAWRAWYVPAAIGLDALSAALGFLLALMVLPPASLSWLHPLELVVFAVLWTGLVALNHGYDARLLGAGPDEFRIMMRTAIAAFAIGGVALVLLGYVDGGRRVILAIALAAALDTLARYGLRKQLHRRRASGRSLQRVLAIGRADGVSLLVDQLSRDTSHGLQVVGVCLSSNRDGRITRVDGVPVEGGVDEVMDVVRRLRPDVVAVASHPDFSGMRLRRLGWELDDLDVELVLVPGVIEVAGPRISVRPAAGLSLLQVERPTASRSSLVGKRMFDLTVGGLALALAAVPMLVIAMLVRATSAGPVLFRQERVGEGGRRFRMLKFRTMVVGAEQMLDELAGRNESDGPLFKIKDDPRVTPVGRWLRRLSLDELPQLMNVLRGEMSLVGPRPPLVHEVESYDDDVVRRLRVKPGITGLWQVSGRADLSWEDSVLLDLRYVDNWSPAMDLMILWKTFRAVVAVRGAY
jgi:exopolysaccharide biosynthesis polyprenyl glycosylphosphotransferase